MIKHQGGAAQVLEEVGGLWGSPAASGLTISSGQVGSHILILKTYFSSCYPKTAFVLPNMPFILDMNF